MDINIEKGKFVVILGPSGAGKSTLLNILGGLDIPDEGKIIVNGNDISDLSGDALADYRVVNDGGFGFTEKDLKAIRAIEGVDAAALKAPE